MFVASTAVSPTIPSSSCAKRFCLSSSDSGAASITSLRRPGRRGRGAAVSRSSACLASSELHRPRGAPRSRCRGSFDAPARAPPRRVVQQRPCPGQACELGDSCAHRAGADDADRRRRVGPSSLGDKSVDSRQRPADDQLLDLGGALVERRHRDVPEIALDRVVVNVAGAAVDLDRGVRRSGSPPRWRRASRSRSRSCSAPGVFEVARAPHEHPGRVGLERRCRQSSPEPVGSWRSDGRIAHAPWSTGPTHRGSPGRSRRTRRRRCSGPNRVLSWRS